MTEVDVPVAIHGNTDDPLGIIRCSGDCRLAASFASQGPLPGTLSHVDVSAVACLARLPSLVEARQMIDDEVDDIPEDFVFVVNGAALVVSPACHASAANLQDSLIHRVG